MRTNAQNKRGLNLVEVLIIIAVFGFFVAILLPAVQTAKHARLRMDCKNNLSQIGLALQMYHDVYGSLPPAYTVDDSGNRLHSWRTLLLPFLEQGVLYNQIDLTQPWNASSNQGAFGQAMPLIYMCPDGPTGNHTLIMAVEDAASCFPGAAPVARPQIIDGPAQTVAIVEAPGGSGVPWMSPEDFDWSRLSSIDERSPLIHAGVIRAVMADGIVREISVNEPNAVRRALITIDAAD